MLHTWPTPERLRDMRSRCLLTQREVVGLTGIAQSTVSEWECGRRRPQTRTLRRLLFVYSVRIQANEKRDLVWAAPDAAQGAPAAQARQPQPAGSLCALRR